MNWKQKTLVDIPLPSDKYTWYQTNDVTDEVANLDVLLENGDTYWLGFENDANCKSESARSNYLP